MTFEALQNELVKSMKERNRIRKNVVADIVTCAKNMAIAAGTKDNITEEIVDAAILKSKKTCQEQIDTCPTNRLDLLGMYKVCMSYIDEFAPKMMTEDEILYKITEIFHDDIPVNKGLIMKTIMPGLKGKADGKLINKVVTELLK
jgi:uncharacterized protein YqeY